MNIQRIRRGILLSGLAILAGATVFAALRWSRMPDQIPTHFGAAGQIDGWGEKASILLLPVTGLLCYSFTALLPLLAGGLWNGPAARKQAALTMLSLISLFIALDFSYITVCSALCVPLGRWFLPVFIGSLALPLAGFILCSVLPAGKRG